MHKAIRPMVMLLVMSLLAGCGLIAPVAPGSTATPPPTPAPQDLEAEEYQVYSSFIRSEFGSHGRVVIAAATRLGLGGSITDTLASAGSELNLNPSTRESFITRNDREYPLIAERFALTMPVVLLQPAQQEEFFSQNGTGWDGFYEKYPDAQGLLTLSRVGFNDTLDQAIVYAGNQSYWLAGAGWLILFEKNGEQWEIANRVMVWIS